MIRSVAAVAVVASLACVSIGQIDDLFSPLLPSESEQEANFSVAAIPSLLRVRPGSQFHVALVVKIAEGWVYYSPDPGPVALPAEITVDAGGLNAGPALWPKDKSKAVPLGDQQLVNNVYTGLAHIYVPVSVPSDAESGIYKISFTLGGQICKEACINLSGVHVPTSVTVGDADVANPDWTAEISARLAEAITADQLRDWHGQASPAAKPGPVAGSTGAKTIWAGLALALLAGLTLNIMPCVLPVIPLRILSIVEMARESRRRFVTLGLAFAAGMVLFFAGLVVVNAALRLATGQAINISDHFTYPGVRIAMAMVMVAISVNLFGAFTVTVPSKVAALEGKTQREGYAKSLGMGFMMAVLATPCSFAYLLAAMAWAQVQPLWLASVTIITIGVGMAGPHVVLSAFPGLLSKLPKPGKWMEIFKQSMGFVLLPVAIWLISTLSERTWPFWVVAYGVVLAFALWMWGSWLRFDAPLGRKLVVRGLAVAVAVSGGLWMLPKPAAPAIAFRSFDENLFRSARDEGRIVLVKVTASWCTECLVIDYRVYDRPEIAEELAARNVLAVKADVTDRGSAASRWVRDQFGAAPPLTAIYLPGEDKPVMLVGGFSKDKLISALDRREGA